MFIPIEVEIKKNLKENKKFKKKKKINLIILIKNK
jgi:hypothetical protein